MQVSTNAPYTNRLQLLLTPYIGPIYQDGPLGFFDPRRDLEIYVDGELLTINTFSYDGGNNRYLMYTATPFNLQGVIQVIHHMPSPPFLGQASGTESLVGFGYVFGNYFGGQPFVVLSTGTTGVEISVDGTVLGSDITSVIVDGGQLSDVVTDINID